MKRAWIVVAAASIVIAGLSYVTLGGEAGGSASHEGDDARATLRNAAGVQIGSVKLEQEGDSVKLKVKVEGVAPGFHGFHIHGTGACDAVSTPPVATDPFTTAGGHYNPGAVTHRDHAGDLPVLLIDGDGEAQARFATDRFALGDLLAGDGSAFILHANADNYANIPVVPYGGPVGATLNTGDAGSRIACGIVESD
jgi:Cu-Zn family superoxide dismutase